MKHLLLMALMSFCSFSIKAFAADQDADGVDDQVDLCPNTTPETQVWKTWEWSGCGEGQHRTKDTTNYVSWLSREIPNCERRADNRIQTVKIYNDSYCSMYAVSYNDIVQPYANMARTDGPSFSALTQTHLAQRYALCLQVERDALNVLNQMYAAGCGDGRDYYNPYPASNSAYYPIPVSSNGTSDSSPSLQTPGFYGPGTTATTTGNVTTDNQGNTYVRTGNVTTSNNGTTYVTNGNVTTSSDGSTYVTNGNVTVGSNGSVCVTTGNVTNCN